MRNILLFVTIITAVILAGCGDGKLKTIKVTGTITFDGAPLEGATINFSPKNEGQGHPAYGTTDASGEYKLQTHLGNADAGTTAGEYVVTISKKEVVLPPVAAPGEMPSMGGPPPAAPKSLIPERYASAATSGFTATVEKGKNVFDFELTK